MAPDRAWRAARWASENPVLSVGELGFEDDTGLAKFGNGTSRWNDLPYWDPGGVLERMPLVYVQPSGDVTGATDQALIDQWLALGRAIRLGEGTYWITGMDLDSFADIEGCGICSRLKHANGANRSVLGLANNEVQGLRLRNFVIDGNKANQSATSHGLNLAHTSSAFSPTWLAGYGDAYHDIADIFTVNCRDNGVNTTGRGDYALRGVKSYSNGGRGFYSSSFDVWHVDCVAGVNGTSGFEVTSLNNDYIGCKAFLNGVDDWLVDVGSNNRFVNCSSQGATRYGFYLLNAADNVVTNLSVIDTDYSNLSATGYSIVLSGGGRNKVHGNVAKVEAGPTPDYAVFFLAASPSSTVDITAATTDFALGLVGGTAAARAGSKIRVNGAEAYTITTYAATVAVDMSAGWVHQITLTGAITLNRPTNLIDGDELTLVMVQDGTGGRAITWGSGFPDKNLAPNLTANSVTVFRFVVAGAGANLYPITSDHVLNVSTVAATGAAEDINAQWPVHDITMDQNATFTFSGAAVVGRETKFKLYLRGAFTPTWPASVDWPDATPPTHTTPSVYEFSTVDAGATWYGHQWGKAYG